jgi:hypothetical protein
MFEPETTKVFNPKVPIVTVSVESTDKIGIPVASFTENNVPVKLSVTENN